MPAIRALRHATRLDPTFEEAHHLLGLTYLDRHWRRKALESFRQAQRLNPKKMRYRDLVGYLSGRSEVPLPRVEGEAARWLERAEKSLQSDHTAEALRCYGRALRLEPDNPTVLMSHALACLQMNRHQESEAITRKVLDLNPGEMLKATAYAALIEALRGEGRYREGNRFGVLLLDEGTSNFAQTIAYYEMAYNLAEMEEDLDQALDYAQRSLELAPDELKEFPLAALGWVHYKRREFAQAVDCLQRSTELERSPTTLTHLGMALLAQGSDEQARTVLREARRLGRAHGVAAGEDDGLPARLDAACSRRSSTGRPSERRRRSPTDFQRERDCDALERLLSLHHARGSGRRRGGEPSPDGARRHAAQAGGRDLRLRAARAAHAGEARGDRALRDEQGRRRRAPDAGDPAVVAVGRVGPLGALRQGAAAHQGPPRARVLLRADARGGGDRPGARRRAQLPPASVHALPDPDQVPRRDPAALRPDARARVHDEGRLLVPRRRGEPGRDLRRRSAPPTAASSTPASSTTPWSRPTPAPSAARRRTSSWCWPRPARARW